MACSTPFLPFCITYFWASPQLQKLLFFFQLYYNLNFTDLARGLLVYPLTGEKFQSLHTLSSEDFLFVAGTATYVLRYDKAVEWTSAALQVSMQMKDFFGGSSILVYHFWKHA